LTEEVRNSLEKIIDKNDEISEVYGEVFNISHMYLPQFMKPEFGFEYNDINRIKDKLGLYDANNITNINEDNYFPEYVDLYYLKDR
jgi:hypothetical protein